MKTPVIASLVLAAASLIGLAPLRAAEPGLNQLTAEEKAAGWRLLFDGSSTNGWRSFKTQTFPAKGWAMEDGILKKIASGGGGDIITVDRFKDFDLRWDWRITKGGNNGVKYFITEERGGAIGHEYQMIDDATVKNDPKSSTAAFYLVVAPKADKPLRPPGEWNQSRILVQGNHVEHWLNGEKALEYELGAEAILKRVAETKFRSVKDFGKKIEGHILLTDHGSECGFRNIKIRELNAR